MMVERRQPTYTAKNSLYLCMTLKVGVNILMTGERRHLIYTTTNPAYEAESTGKITE